MTHTFTCNKTKAPLPISPLAGCTSRSHLGTIGGPFGQCVELGHDVLDGGTSVRQGDERERRRVARRLPDVLERKWSHLGSKQGFGGARCGDVGAWERAWRTAAESISTGVPAPSTAGSSARSLC